MGYLGATTDGIRTPGYVLAEMRTIDSLVQSLDQDIASEPDKTDLAFKRNFVAFKQEWDAFFKENSTGIFGGWLSRAMNSVYDKAMEYRELAMTWRARFEKSGGKPSSIPLPKSSKFSIWPYAIGGGLALGAAYLIFGRGQK